MRREFFQSPHHAALAAATLGVGFATGEPLYFILGAAAYVVGWVFLPDLDFFRQWVQGRQQQQVAAQEAGEVASFKARRDATLSALTNSRRTRYAQLAEVCSQIEHAVNQPDDPRMRKLEELMWTFLRLLSTEQSLERFMELESRENVPRLLQGAAAELERLEAEVTQLRTTQPNSSALDAKERLLETRRDLRDALAKRVEHYEQAQQHSELVLAEQQRLEQQIKLLRADAMAAPSTAAISARIDATVEQLAATNSWLKEMDQFRAAIAEPALPNQRIGFGAAGANVPPPLPVRRGKEEAR